MEQLNKLPPLSSDEMPPETAVDPNELKDAEPAMLAEAIAKYLDGKKGADISLLDVAEKTSLTSYFVFCTATSSTHVKALCDEVDYQTTRRGFAPIHEEGRAGGAWALLDYGPVIVHIFTRDARDFYRVERLYEGEAEV